PREARRFSIDPHSEGTSIDRVKPDPNRPEGREDMERASHAAKGHPDGAGGGVRARQDERRATQTPRVTGADGLNRQEPVAAATPVEPGSPGVEGREPGPKGSDSGVAAEGQETRENFKQALSNI